MKIPSYSDFKAQLDIEAAAYDFENALTAFTAGNSLPFSAEQVSALASCSVAVSLALLQQYHTWLSETLQSLHESE